MTNSEKLALIRRVLDAPITFDTDDAMAAIQMIVIDGLDPFDAPLAAEYGIGVVDEEQVA